MLQHRDAHLEIATRALTASHLDDAWPLFLNHLLDAGGDSHILMHYNHDLSDVRRSYPVPEQTFAHAFQPEWLERGRTDPSFVRSDPFAKRGLRSSNTIFVDASRPETVADNPSEEAFVNGLYDLGLRFGLCVPLHNHHERSLSALCVGVGFNVFDGGSDTQRALGRFRLLATYFNEGIQLRERLDEFGRSPLAPRERECLAWAAIGRTTAEIGDTLKLADSTVNQYIKSASKKLGASNRTQACSRAFLLSLIEP